MAITKKYQLKVTGSRGPFLESPGPESFRARKGIFSLSVSKNGEVYMPETSCMKWTAVHIKNMWIKQVCNPKVWDLAMAFRARKGPEAFEKRAPDGWNNVRKRLA